MKKMAELKEKILEEAGKALKIEDNKRVAQEMARKRAEKDAAIAKKKQEEGEADDQDKLLAEGKKADPTIEENTWIKGSNVQTTGSPDKPLREDRPQRGPPRNAPADGGDMFLTRSDKPRAQNQNQNEEAKGEKPSFRRGPSNKEGDSKPAGDGLSRGGPKRDEE